MLVFRFCATVISLIVANTVGLKILGYVEERGQLKNWAHKKGNDGIKEYWEKRKQVSLDGEPTNILEKNV